MKKNANRRSRSRLQTLGTAELAQVTGGVSIAEYYTSIVAVSVAIIDAVLPGR